MGFWDAVRGRTARHAGQPRRAVPGAVSAAITLQTARPHADRHRLGLLPGGRGRGVPRRRRPRWSTLLNADPEAPDVQVTHRRLRLHLAAVDPATRRRRRHLHRPARREHRPGGAGVRVRPAVLAGAVRRRRRAPGRAWSTSTSRARSTRSPRPAPQQRDNLLEIQVRDALAGELPIEQDLQRWLAVWGPRDCDGVRACGMLRTRELTRRARRLRRAGEPRPQEPARRRLHVRRAGARGGRSARGRRARS